MAQKDAENGVVERGDIYFFYRPKVEREHPRSAKDVERLYLVLSPEGKKLYREIIIGRKALPSVEGGERNWAFVKAVVHDPRELERELGRESYQTKTRGTREIEAARPAGEGVYAITRHDGHTHLAYSLELPEKPGVVQRALKIAEEASYVISVKNPEKGSPPQAGLRSDRKAHYPEKLQKAFAERRFMNVERPELLDYPGAEIMLIGADEDPERELGIRLDPELETAASADIFKELKLNRSEHPVRPLFEGRWE